MTAATAVSPVSLPIPTASARSASIDVARGLIVALMALDHVRIFFSAAQFDPVDLDATSPGFFFTRWITHLCAPGFFFLAGLGAALFEARAGRVAAARFLVTRGAMLILLEVLVCGLAWAFNPGWFWFGVIWGLGASMILLACLIWLGRPAVLVIGLGFTLVHNILVPALGDPGTAAHVLLYSGGMISMEWLGPRIVLYPVLPWLALMMIGFGAANWLAPDRKLSVGRASVVGAAAVLLFVLLRTLSFGEPAGGSAANDGSMSLLSFLNVEKYPPSLQYSCVTIGLLLLFAAAVERISAEGVPRALRPLLVFGEVPLFFYLMHLFVIHGLAVVVAIALGWPTAYLFWLGVGPNLVPPAGFGFWLPGIYAVWIFVLAVLLPPCAAFAQLKRTDVSWWLKYL